MRKLVLTLALSSVALAGSTVYFAHELFEERARNGAAASLAASPPVVSPASPARPELSRSVSPSDVRASTAAVPAKTEAVGLTARSLTEQEIKAAQVEFGRTFLAQIADPQGREDLISERKMIMRHAYPMLDKVLGLSSAEHARLLELFALQQLEMQEHQSRCAVDPHCRFHELRFNEEPHQQQIAELLGQERVQKFESYKNSLGERESITQMRMRLPDAQRLADENAEGLITALAEERASINREAAQRGQGVNAFGVGAGMLYTTTDGTLETQYDAARQYSQRLRERAAQYLNSEQLRVFNELQDEQLVTLRSLLRNKGYSAVAVPLN
jgi:hypothetical protein